jgi:hypothetical protein
MDEDAFNMSLRKFLKQVGVTSQREIEAAVREAVAKGKVKGKGPLKAKMTLVIDSIGLRHEIEEEIKLA